MVSNSNFSEVCDSFFFFITLVGMPEQLDGLLLVSIDYQAIETLSSSSNCQ